MMYHGEPNRSAPDDWITVGWSVRRPGCAAYSEPKGLAEGRRDVARANTVASGHKLYQHQEHARGWTRSVDRTSG